MLRCSPLLLALLGTTHAAPAPLVGVASVIDGDTLEIRGVRVRLYGIDAPEFSQTCTKARAVYRVQHSLNLKMSGTELVRIRWTECRAGRIRAPDRYTPADPDSSNHQWIPGSKRLPVIESTDFTVQHSI